MGELEQTNPDFRESCKKIRKGLAAYRKLKKEVYKHIMQEKAAFNQDINFHVNYIQQKKDEAVERVMQSENYKSMQSAKRKYKALMTKLTKTHSLQKWDTERYFREYRCWRWNNNPAKSYLRVYIWTRIFNS